MKKRFLLVMTMSFCVGMAQANQACNPNIRDEWPDDRYTVDASVGTVVDKYTGLMWKRCIEGNVGSQCETANQTVFTWRHALTVAEESNYAGYTDWRVPNIKELYSLVKANCVTPAINATVFPNMPPGAPNYWSSSILAGSGTTAWWLNFSNGQIKNNNPRTNPVRLRLVRDVNSPTPRLPQIVVKPTNIKLNDTGMTFAGENATTNSVNCVSSIVAPQDCQQGRDAEWRKGDLKKIGGGKAGFDFSKLGADGKDLAVQNASWSDTGIEADGTSWSCVRDNHTGLVWEVKNGDATSLNFRGDYFSYYNTNYLTNASVSGPHSATTRCSSYQSGDESTYCNTQAFTARVNKAKLCGFDDWRVPESYELQSIVDYSAREPAIDTGYFPGTRIEAYWTNNVYVSNALTNAWNIRFVNGALTNSPTLSTALRLRLVRGNE